jgi:nitrilase
MLENTVRVAVAQAAAVLMDRSASVKKACELITLAGEQRAKVLLFPEAFISGYPRGLQFDSRIGSRGMKGRTDWARYWESSITIPGPETEQIAQVIQKARLYVALGVIERDIVGSGGTLYCTLLYFDPEGRILGKHRKIKPAAMERVIWGEGDGSTLAPVPTAYGLMGGLICWENYMPQARLHLYSQGVRLYLAPTADARDTWQATLRHIACEGRCFVLAANQYVTKSMYPPDLACAEELEHEPEIMCRGGSAIIDPLGDYVVLPVYNEEKLLLADLDLQKIEQAHMDLDVVGHYARPDIYTLLVNERPQQSVITHPLSEVPSIDVQG